MVDFANSRNLLHRSGLVRTFAFVILVGTCTCNVFRSVEDCETDGDCAGGRVCESVAKRCVPAPEVTSPSDAAVTDARDASDGEPDARDAAVPCEERGWGPARLVSGLENEPIISARLTPDELSMYISRGTPPTFVDIYTVVRSDVSQPFQVKGPLAVVNEPGTSEFWPTLSADGRLLFFESSRSTLPDDAGVYKSVGARIWSASRVNVVADFDRPKLQSLFDVEGPEAAPYLHPSGRTLYFASSSRPGKGQLDIWFAEINSAGVVTDIRNLESANTTTDENAPVVTVDERYLYHNRLVDPATLENDIWVARRSTVADGFGKSVRVSELSTPYDEYPTWVSPDHCRIYFSSDRPTNASVDAAKGSFHLWVSERDPSR